jgi:hypothetical protein
MLPGQVRLGRIFGIEIGLHFSWFKNQLPVLEGGQIRGVISRDHILRLVAARAELSM